MYGVIINECAVQRELRRGPISTTTTVVVIVIMVLAWAVKKLF